MAAITRANGSAARQAARVRGSVRAAATRIAVANSERRNVTPSGVECAKAPTATGPATCTEGAPATIASGAGNAGRRALPMTCPGLDTKIKVSDPQVAAALPVSYPVASDDVRSQLGRGGAPARA